MNTDQLIMAMAADAAPTRPFSRAFGYATILGVAGAGMIFFAAIGPRPDLMEALHTWRFPLKFVITMPLAIIAVITIRQMARPGMWHKYNPWRLFCPLCLLLIAALFELFVLPRSLWMVRLIGSNSANCMTLIPLLAIVPLACFLVALRNGAPSDPERTGAAAGLAAAAIAASFYALNCFDDSPLFVITWYPLATSIVVAAGYLAGRSILKW